MRKLAVFVFAAATAVRAGQQSAAKTTTGGANVLDDKPPVRVLFIGNSYTYYNNLPALVAQLSGGRIETRMVVRGGANLQQIWDLGEAPAAIREGRWDYVVLQDHSLLGGMRIEGVEHVNEPDFFYDNIRMYDAEIKKVKAKTILYLTWARRAAPEQQQFLTYAYTTIAQEIGALLAPVGIAWQRIRETDPSLLLHISDGTHPTPAGSYVAACVLTNTILGKPKTPYAARVPGNPIAANERPDPSRIVDLVNLSPERAEFLQKHAAEAFPVLPAQKPVYPSRSSLPPVKRPFTPADISGVWRGTLRFYATPMTAELRVTTEGQTCSGQFAIWTQNDDRRVRAPISSCRVTDVGVTFVVQDYRGIGPSENYWAHYTGDGLVGWSDYRGLAKSSRLMGAFELKKQKPQQ